ncbi:MAG: hypothetical protein IJ298_00160 [Ruminococcus sp.]|nr:hypothetical protein [Ruminococcus sp.]
MDFPKRKPTRLKGFNYSSHGAYFITICTKNKANMLCRVVGGGAFDAPQINLTSIGKIVEKYILSTNNISNVTVDKYVIMPNHIHMIIFVDNADGMSRAPSPTNEVIPHLVSTLKRFVNLDVSENIFQRSYNDHIIRDYKGYYTKWKYIDDNPAKWAEDKYYCE